MGKVNVIYDDLYSSANNLEGVIDYLNQAKGQLEFISTAIGIINRNHDCFSKTEQGIADLKREFANYITEVTFLQNQCRNAANAFKDVEGKNVKATDSMLAVINDATTMLGQDKITDPDITAYNKRKDFEESKEHWDEATATDRSKTWNNTFVENDDKMVSINSAFSTQAESVIDPEKEEEEQQEKESEEPLKDEQESQHGGDHGNDEEPVYNPPKGTAPSEEKPEGNKQGKTDLGTKKSDSTEDKKDDPLKEAKTETESGKETDQGTKKGEEPSTVTPPSDTQTETTTTTTTPTEPQQETYVPPAETNNNNNWQPSNSNNNNNYNNYSNETPINNDVETGEETMTTEPEIPEGSDETAPSSEMPDDEIVKGNEYTKIPTSDTPIETKHKSGNSFIPIAAGLSAAAAAGIGAKAYMDRKNNNDNGEDDFTSEEWDGDESTISDYNTGNKVEIQEDTLEEDPINDNVEPEKYGARNNEELVDIQQ